VPINIPALNLPIALFLGNSTIDSLEQLPKQLGSICADQMKMHASSWASIIIMFFLFIAVGYAFISSSQKQINQLADRLVDIGHQGQERLGFLHGHKKNYSV
jgi:hypothetical protein